MYRVSIKIERLPVTIRRTPQSDETTPELLVQAKGTTLLGAIGMALRILTGERDSLTEQTPVKFKVDSEPFEDDEDED